MLYSFGFNLAIDLSSTWTRNSATQKNLENNQDLEQVIGYRSWWLLLKGSWSLDGKCLETLQTTRGCPDLVGPWRNIFLVSSSSFTSESGMHPGGGIMEALHFCQSTNIFAALFGFIDLAIRNLINVGFSYPFQSKQQNNRWIRFSDFWMLSTKLFAMQRFLMWTIRETVRQDTRPKSVDQKAHGNKSQSFLNF